MRVGFNARLLHAPSLRGWNRYCINLLAELPDLGVELFLYSEKPVHSIHTDRLPKGSYTVRLAPAMKYIQWEQNWLPKQCAADQVEVLHCPFNFGLPWLSHCPRVLTLHDAIGKAFYSKHSSIKDRLDLSALRNSFHHWIARTRAHKIITVSEHAKGELIKHLKIPAEKIVVTYEAADQRFHQPISEAKRRQVREKYSLRKPYVFYIGGWELRKNVPFLVRAFAQSDLENIELVLAGGKDDQLPLMKQLTRDLKIENSARLLSWVDDDDLPTLYAEAMCFVYPSLHEGFGLQLCEAMAVGCPTIAARKTSLPEVLGDGGETFNTRDTKELAAILHRIVNDKTYCTALARQAEKRATNFSWQHTAVQTIATYRCVLDAN